MIADVVANVKIWYRSPSSVFFTVAFPLLLILIFGAMFTGEGGPLTVAVQDQDGSRASARLLVALEATDAVRLEHAPPEGDPMAWAIEQEHHTLLVVPAGYGRALASDPPAHLQLATDPSHQASATASTVVRAVVQELNTQAMVGEPPIQLDARPMDPSGQDAEIGYVAFLMPGIIGMTVTTNALLGGLEQAATLKQTGVLRKVATTPVRRFEWVLAKALYQVFLAAITTAVIVVVGALAFGVALQLTWSAVALLVATGAGFAGLAMAMSRWVTKPDQANAAGSAVAFPMIFLSGVFWPLESMPGGLQAVARALPLTYVNEALRAAMVTGLTEPLVENGLAVLTMAALALGAGSLLLDWKEL